MLASAWSSVSLGELYKQLLYLRCLPRHRRKYSVGSYMDTGTWRIDLMQLKDMMIPRDNTDLIRLGLQSAADIRYLIVLLISLAGVDGHRHGLQAMDEVRFIRQQFTCRKLGLHAIRNSKAKPAVVTQNSDGVE